MGDGRPWREPSDYVFALSGDIVGFREAVMNVPGVEKAFRKFWEPVVRRVVQDLGHGTGLDGDRVNLVDASPVKLMRAAQSIANQLQNSEFGLLMRFGGHSGFWRLAGGGDHDGSAIIGVAARIESAGEPGTLAVTEKFIRGLEELDNKDLQQSFVRDGADTVVSKPNEALEQYRLFRTPLGDHDAV